MYFIWKDSHGEQNKSTDRLENFPLKQNSFLRYSFQWKYAFALTEFNKEICQLLQMQKKQLPWKVEPVKNIKSYKSQKVCHFS